MQKIFNTIQEFITSQYNIFTHRTYEYPTLFQQKLFVAFLEFQEILSNSHEDIIKILNSLNNKNLQNIAMGSLYSMMLYFSQDISKQVNISKEEQQKNTIKYQKAQKLNKYLKSIRTQTWSLVNKLFVQLIQTHFSDIKYKCKFSIVKIFQKLQQLLITSEDLCLIILKCVNIYEIDPFTISFNKKILQELFKIIQKCSQFSYSQKQQKGSQYKNQNPELYSQQKYEQQANLMCNYLFPKLFTYELIVHQLHLSNDRALDQINKLSRSIIFRLFAFNSQQCLVFQEEILRYVNFLEHDHELESLVKKIKQNSLLSKEQLIQNKSLAQRHFQLLPLLSSIIIPIQMNKCFTILFQQTASDKYNINLILEWLWNHNSFLSQFKNVKDSQKIKQYSKYYRKEYPYLLVQLVRMITTSSHQNYQSFFILEWALYKVKMSFSQQYSNNTYVVAQSSAQANVYNRMKQAFFNDWILYLMNSNKFNTSSINAKQSIIHNFNLLGSLQALNYLIYYSPNLAQDLLVHILLIQIKIPNYNASQTRGKINLVLKQANDIGLLKINEILRMCPLSNHIKDELSVRINQKAFDYENIPIYQSSSTTKAPVNLLNQSSSSETDKKIDNIYESPMFFHNQNTNPFQLPINIQSNISFSQKQNPLFSKSFSSEQQIIYSSQQIIPGDERDEVQYHQQSLSSMNNSSKITVKNQQILKMEIEQMSQNFQQSNDQQSPMLRLQKQFVQELGEQLTVLLKDPTFVNFKEFLSKLLKVLKEYKKDNQNQSIDLFIFEASKVIYIMFNSHFQDYSNFSTIKTSSMFQNANNSVPQFFLKFIYDYWKQSISNYTVLTYKKIVKTMVQKFPSCQIRFYVVFINVYRKGVPYFKQMKQWLINKENCQIILPVFQRIMSQSQKLLNINFFQNMQALKLK